MNRLKYLLWMCPYNKAKGGTPHHTPTHPEKQISSVVYINQLHYILRMYYSYLAVRAAGVIGIKQASLTYDALDVPENAPSATSVLGFPAIPFHEDALRLTFIQRFL